MTRIQVHNRKEFENRRKSLRKKLTAAEATLWTLLKKEQLEGRKFRRQNSVGNYILDFLLSDGEVGNRTGWSHHFTDEGSDYDEQRTNYLNTLRIQVIRFENEEVFQSPEGVLAEIKKYFKVTDFRDRVSNVVTPQTIFFNVDLARRLLYAIYQSYLRFR